MARRGNMFQETFVAPAHGKLCLKKRHVSATMQKQFLASGMLPLFQNWESLGKHARAASVSGNMFPRFARALVTDK